MTPAAVALEPTSLDELDQFAAALETVGFTSWRTTLSAARTFRGRLDRAGRWERVDLETQLEWMRKARPFVSWLLVTGRLTASAEFLARSDLRLGSTAAKHLPETHAWFLDAAARVGAGPASTKIQWNALAKAAALSGVRPDEIETASFDHARSVLTDAYARRGQPESGRNVRSVFHRLQLTLFHAGKIDTLARPGRASVAETGWAAIAPAYERAARRYIEQVTLSLRPSTVKHIEHHLRVFGTWLADNHPDITSCAGLTRGHIEQFKKWLSTHPSKRTGRPLSRSSIKEQLINLGCFFDRITEWGYADPPLRPLLFAGDLPITDKPLPRFLDDAAAAKLARATRAEPDPLARLCVEILSRTGIRLSELLALTVDAVVQIGSAFWLRIPLGKLHNDRYIPLHPQLKELLDDWVDNQRSTGLRSDLLLIEKGRPVTKLRIADALGRLGREAGIGHVTPHQLRHTLATQAINRGMSLDAIAALLGHKTLAMTMVYARIADKTVADEYFAVTEKVEALYDQPRKLPADDEGSEMSKLRGEMHRRMLGNGYCARPVEMDCHFESICESCTFFVTTLEFRPTLAAQRKDAARKGQVGRQKIFDGLLERLDNEAS
ncbi:MAG: site-specific integrase [Actinobacteria bacterium]|nr:site-specific integrase [Actinomycetota bacterium]